MKSQKGQIVEAFAILIGSFLVVGFFVLLFSLRISSLGEGKHNGYITAVEQEGWFFPNYRVYVKTDNSSSQEDVYCMHRNKIELANELKELSASKTHVSVEYKGVRGFGIDICSGQEVTGVKVLE